MGEGPPRPATHPAGFDETDPYEGEDLSEYPDWWRENIYEFREHGMRPYRPPRFEDNELAPPLIRELEQELGITIQLRVTSPEQGNSWELYVDDEGICPVDHRRAGEGYSVYEMESSEFERAVYDAVDRDRTR